MKKILFPIVLAVLMSACGGAQEGAKNTMTEDELINGFETVRSKFNEIFDNPGNYSQNDLKPLNDSLVMYVDAMVDNFPKSSQLPDLLCRAGVTSLNVKNSEKALEYLNYVADSFPEHPTVPKAMYFIGRTKEVVVEDIEGAKEAYKALYRAFPKSVWGMNARSSVEQIINPISIEQEDVDSLEVED